MIFIIMIFALVSKTYGLGISDHHFIAEMTRRAAETRIMLRIENMFRENWISQPLDHLNPKDTRKYNMRYFEEPKFFKDNGPIYISVNGEWTAEDNFEGSIMYQLARETNGAMFEVEHRYYGASVPNAGDSILHPRNYDFLSSEQALADFANFIKFLKKSAKFSNSKVVLIGGSYAGNLVAWMKHLYPDLVYAGIASGAPVLAKKDFYEYIEHVGKMYKKFGVPGCYERIQEIFNRYDTLLKTKKGIEQLKKESEIYWDLDTVEAKQDFLYSKTLPFCTTVQSNTKYLKTHCQNLMHHTRSVDGKEMSPGMTRADNNGWKYQFCSEFGYIQTSHQGVHPFSKNITLEPRIKTYCTSAYGKQFDEGRIDKGVAATNKRYGGLKPNVPKIVFVYGEMDPWSTLGVKEAADVTVVRINGSTHCEDLLAIMPYDPDALTAARKKIMGLIKNWLH